MTDIPRIFSDDGKLIEIDASKLDAPMRERYAAIVTAQEQFKLHGVTGHATGHEHASAERPGLHQAPSIHYHFAHGNRSAPA